MQREFNFQDWEIWQKLKRDRNLRRGDIATALICLGLSGCLLLPGLNHKLKDAIAPVAEEILGVKLVSSVPTTTTSAKTTFPITGQNLATAQMTSPFGWRNIGGIQQFHNGVDFAIPIGTNLLAPEQSTVNRILQPEQSNGGGLVLELKLNDGSFLQYMHLDLSPSNPLVKVGAKVIAGQVVARSGNSGNSTGPHLHISHITSNGQRVDPMPYLKSLGAE